jgi:hypothetical protein
MVGIPALIALGLTAITDGWRGVRAFLATPGQWRVRPGWIAIAIALGLGLRLGMGVLALLLGVVPALTLRPWTPLQFGVFALLLFVFAVPEGCHNVAGWEKT